MKNLEKVSESDTIRLRSLHSTERERERSDARENSDKKFKGSSIRAKALFAFLFFPDQLQTGSSQFTSVLESGKNIRELARPRVASNESCVSVTGSKIDPRTLSTVCERVS